MINVFIADDHTLIREGFKKILERESDIRVVGEAGSAFEVLDFLKQHSCHILVLDLSMPDKNGLDLLGDIGNLYPKVKTLILTMHAEEHYAIRALKAGAAGYLTKESAPDELIKAIRSIVAGHLYISQNIAEQLAYSVGGKIDKMPHERLSDREFQIMRLLAEGKATSEISRELSISTSTVSTYRQRIMRKLNVRSIADVILYAVNNRLIET
jgi:two-component system invasion response regulator UvrY